MIRDYCLALDQWKQQHPDEYENAWLEWNKKRRLT